MLYSKKETMLKSDYYRFNMLCKDCNWEWMSNITKSKPKTCPKCKKNNLEMVGYKNIKNPQNKKDSDLRSFISH